MNSNKKKHPVSIATIILASLRRWPVIDSKNLIFGHYMRLLAGNRNAATYRSSLSRLVSGGMVIKKGDMLSLAPQATYPALASFIETETALHQPSPKEWDGGWRIILFDIPEAKRKYRDSLRWAIRAIGFRPIHRSTWVYPYPVPVFLKNLLMEDAVKNHIRFITTETIEHDSDLRLIFNLPHKKARKRFLF